MANVELDPVYADDLRTDWPQDSDTRREGGQHLRNIKEVLVNQMLRLDGNPLDRAVLAQVFPIGATTIVPANSGTANPPETQYGGTWAKIGTIDIPKMVADGYFTYDAGWNYAVGPELDVFQLITIASLPT